MIRLPITAGVLRLAACLAVLAALAACSSPDQTSAKQETARYLAHARGNYTPPGPPSDPWGPYIKEASVRFDMPETWVRAVMRQESGGRLYRANGDLITSGAGAMGLMQVMPGTYDELRSRYDLGDDPFHPRDNIMAGVAYMREMYDIYGSPGFLAAYNAGPARLDDYLTNNRGLPDETRKYVASIGPNLYGQPNVRSPAEQFEMNALPLRIPAGLRYGRGGAVQLASNGVYNAGSGRTESRQAIQVAQVPVPAPVPVVVAAAPIPAAAPVPPPVSPAPRQQYAVAITPPAPVAAPVPAAPAGIRLIAPAMAAETSAMRRGGSSASGTWAIQVGAYANQAQAQAAINQARDQARGELGVGKPTVGTVTQGHSILYRARMTGLAKETAVQACQKIARGKMNCIVLSPDAQS